ncbi:MAG TPA: tRNA pseudouridine(55) synthase TruB [Bryobacteraceae bacterium]|jgi:tRNA pseudouridine55 synthase|nr:tRNA pseudouridine(55) synthase TruB [Bryobacteraceae bacterium]
MAAVQMDGVIVVDKSPGMTSHDVVNRVRRLAGTRRVGHLGTLDPMATGVLPLVVERATRLAPFLTGGSKRYDAVIRFGYSTNTYDREGETVGAVVEPSFTRAGLAAVLQEFQGVFLQKPPAVSAKKVAGTPAYKLARKNVAVDLAPVEVTVYSIVLHEFETPLAKISVHCGSGTYIRSIAHDVGQRLQCGAVLEELRRTASGAFTLDNARTMDELMTLAGEARLHEALVPAASLIPEFPSERVDALTAGRIRQGRDFRLSPFRPDPDARYVKAIGEEGELVAIGEARLPHVYHPVLVL